MAQNPMISILILKLFIDFIVIICIKTWTKRLSKDTDQTR